MTEVVNGRARNKWNNDHARNIWNNDHARNIIPI